MVTIIETKVLSIIRIKNSNHTFISTHYDSFVIGWKMNTINTSISEIIELLNLKPIQCFVYSDFGISTSNHHFFAIVAEIERCDISFDIIYLYDRFILFVVD